MYRLVKLSVTNNGFGIEVKYDVLQDYCTQNEISTSALEMYEFVQYVASELKD